MALTFGQDHGAIAFGNWLNQFAGKPALEPVVRSLFAPFVPLDAAFRDMMLARGLTTAQGAQLDGIGTIVGQPRTVQQSVFKAFFGFSSQDAGRGFGQAAMRRNNESFADSVVLSDADYRALIHLKIALNNGHGTTPEIIKAAQAIFAVPRVIVQNNGNATISVSIGRLLRADEILAAHASTYIPRAAGVGITLTESPPVYFGFSNQGLAGFGVGTLSRVFN
ncbi:MAG: hypothetical protein JWP29_3534 [Rhodoferax sp.]|nr:hypothetical protein [Rhodoferax sp.]